MDDDDGYGHYWLDSEMLHSVVCRVDEDYDVVDRVNFISEDGVAEYVRKHELQGLSDLAEEHLEEDVSNWFCPTPRYNQCMCGRYGLWAAPKDLEQRFAGHIEFDYEPRYNIAPEGSGAAAIQNEAPDEINQLSWGICPHWVDDPDDWHHPINARAETVAEKPSFRDAFKKRRCLIPANNFYEWSGPKGKRVPYYIGVEDQEIFSMAGLWETWSDNGNEFQSFSIITTDANEVVGELHDQVPVILDQEEEERWLESEAEDELQQLLDSFPDERTETFEVSKTVNSPANEGPELIEPVGSDQSGLGYFV